MKRFGFCLFALIVLACLPVAHANMGVSLSASTSSIAASVMTDITMEHRVLAVGGEGIYKSDDYAMLSGILAVKNDQFTPGINYRVGFRGFYLEAEDGGSNAEASASGLAFLFGLDYELGAGLNPLPIPVNINAQVAASPGPLTWGDGEYYWEVGGGIGFHVLSNATVRVDLRKISAKFEEKGYEWSKDDYNLILGYEIRF